MWGFFLFVEYVLINVLHPTNGFQAFVLGGRAASPRRAVDMRGYLFCLTASERDRAALP